MKSTLKKILAGSLISLSVLILAATLALFWLFRDPSRWMGILTGTLKKETGLVLETASASFHLLKGIELRSIVLKYPDPSGKELKILEADSLSLWYSPKSLFSGKLEISSIQVYRPRTSIKKIQTLLQSGIFQTEKKQSGESSQGLLLHRINLRQMTLEGFPHPLVADLEYNLDSVQSPISLKGQYGKSQFSLKGSLKKLEGSVENFAFTELFPNSIPLKIQDLKFRLEEQEGQVYRLRADSASGEYELFGILLPFHARQALNGEIRLKDSSFSLERTEFEIPGGWVTLGYLLDWKEMSHRLSLGFDQLMAGEFLKGYSGRVYGDMVVNYNKRLMLGGAGRVEGISGWFGQNGEAEWSIRSNTVAVKAVMTTSAGLVRGELSMEDLMKSDLTVKVNVAALDLKKALEIYQSMPRTTNSAENKTSTNVRNFRIQVSAARIQYEAWPFEAVEVKGVFPMHWESWSVDEIHGKLFRGTVSGKLRFEDGAMNGSAEISGLKLRELSATLFGNQRQVFGELGATASFSWRNSTGLEGNAVLRAKDGEIRDFFAQNEIAKALDGIPLQDIYFDSVDAGVAFSSNVLRLENFFFDSSDIRIRGSGDYQLNQKKLGVQAEFDFSKAYLDGLPNVARLYTRSFNRGDRTIFDLRVSGSLSNLSVKVVQP